jgi:ribosomal protein S27E
MGAQHQQLPPLLEATGQRTTLARSGYIFFGSLFVFLAARWSESWLPFEALLAAATLAAIAMVFAVFYAFARVRCPECELAWVRWSVTNQPHTRWLHWLYEFTSCPKCGYTTPTSIGGTAQPNRLYMDSPTNARG